MSDIHQSPPPDLGTLRIATPSDILRLGNVVYAAAPGVSRFRWTRPHHKEFPDDTLLSFRSDFVAYLKDDNYIVLVQEDAYIPDENAKARGIIRQDNGWSPPEAGEKVIVGVMAIKLDPNSPRKGQLKSHDGE